MLPRRTGADGSPHGLADRLLARVLQPRQVVDAGAADNAEDRLRHAVSMIRFVGRISEA